MPFLTCVLLAGLATQSPPVSPFHAVSLSGAVHATLRKGEKPAVTLTGEPSALSHYEAVVEKGTLVIRRKDGGWLERGFISADITAPALDGVEASGGCVVTGEGPVAARCTVDLSGGAEARLQHLACEALGVEASGGAQLRLDGAARTLTLDASGGVHLDTRALEVKTATISASGGVSGDVAVADELSAELSGAASVRVKGHPRVARQETSGVASLVFRSP